MSTTPELVGLLAAALAFVVLYGLRGQRFAASRRSRQMQELLGSRQEDAAPVEPPPRGLPARLDGLGLSITPSTFYLLSGLVAVGGFVAATSAGLPTMPALLAGLAGTLLPKTWLDRREKGRDKALADALPEGLNALASALATFPDLSVALNRSAELLDAQGYVELAEEFSRLSRDVGLLGPEQAVADLKARTGSEALRFTGTLLSIYARHGGRVLPALEARAENLRMLIEARKEAEGAVNDARLAGLAVPLIMALVILTNLRDPQAAEVYRTGIGQALLVGAAASCYVGYRVVMSMAENIG